jgi:hypothetical protein
MSLHAPVAKRFLIEMDQVTWERILAWQRYTSDQKYLERLDDAQLFHDYLNRRIHVEVHFEDEFEDVEIRQILPGETL